MSEMKLTQKLSPKALLTSPFPTPVVPLSLGGFYITGSMFTEWCLEA